MYITICEVDDQSRFNACTGCSGLMHCGGPEGWDGEGGGRGVQDGGHMLIPHVDPPWLIHVSVWQKPPQYFKVISLQLK